MPDTAPRPSDVIADRLVLTDPHSRIRRHTAADDAFCRTLFHEQRAPLFAALGLGDEALRMWLDQQYQAQRTSFAQRFPVAETCIVECAGAAVGRLVVTLGQPPEGTTLHLVDITLAAAARNRGIGSDVIESLARTGHALCATRFTLLVLRSNEAALRLYQRLGFVATVDGTHVLMIRQLP